MGKLTKRIVQSINDNEEIDYHNPEKRNVKLNFRSKARYIKVTLKNYGVCPSWHLGAGGDTWIFLDEIEID